MDDGPGSTVWINSKTVVEFLLEEEAQEAYPRELSWILDILPKNSEMRRQMFRSKEDHSIDMTLAGFTYLLACRRWPEGGYSADEYDAIALSASKVFPAMATREEVKLAGKKQTGGQLNAGCRTLAAAGATGREQIFIPLRFVLKQLGGLARLGARQATKRPGGERNMPEIARPRL